MLVKIVMLIKDIINASWTRYRDKLIGISFWIIELPE